MACYIMFKSTHKEGKSSIQASLTKDDALDILLERSVTNICAVFGFSTSYRSLYTKESPQPSMHIS